MEARSDPNHVFRASDEAVDNPHLARSNMKTAKAARRSRTEPKEPYRAHGTVQSTRNRTEQLGRLAECSTLGAGAQGGRFNGASRATLTPSRWACARLAGARWAAAALLLLVASSAADGMERRGGPMSSTTPQGREGEWREPARVEISRELFLPRETQGGPLSSTAPRGRDGEWREPVGVELSRDLLKPREAREGPDARRMLLRQMQEGSGGEAEQIVGRAREFEHELGLKMWSGAASGDDVEKYMKAHIKNPGSKFCGHWQDDYAALHRRIREGNGPKKFLTFYDLVETRVGNVTDTPSGILTRHNWQWPQRILPARPNMSG